LVALAITIYTMPESDAMATKQFKKIVSIS